MPRPRLNRKIESRPEVFFFKPQGVPLVKLEIIELSMEEWEAIRLKHQEKLSQNQSAKCMNTSQSTFQRILCSAQNKIGQAIVEGKAIKINKDH